MMNYALIYKINDYELWKSSDRFLVCRKYKSDYHFFNSLENAKEYLLKRNEHISKCKQKKDIL